MNESAQMPQNQAQAALVLAPMDGITDAPMRALQGEIGAFSYSVTEFLRVSIEQLPRKVFLRDVPELNDLGKTPTGLPVQVQILGGDPERMAISAVTACRAGAHSIDINFGCPAPTVNRNDGGASLLRHPDRIREIVRAVRDAVPPEIPVSAKLRLGWESIEDIHVNAQMVAEGGASWITIHARTKAQGYNPPVFWKPIGVVRSALDIPVVANGDIWTLEDFYRCQDETGCNRFMLGRSALANPSLSHQVARELGLPFDPGPIDEWEPLLRGFLRWCEHYKDYLSNHVVKRLKQWLSIASRHGEFAHFDVLKRTITVDEFFAQLHAAEVTKNSTEDGLPSPMERTADSPSSEASASVLASSGAPDRPFRP